MQIQCSLIGPFLYKVNFVLYLYVYRPMEKCILRFCTRQRYNLP